MSQNFTYSGYIYNADGTGAVNVPVKLYKRTTPVINGFTSQNNYNGHSYYRSTGSMFWTDARQACLNMGGHLVTVTSSAENSFIFGIWPSGWIGLTDEVVKVNGDGLQMKHIPTPHGILANQIMRVTKTMSNL